MSLRGIPNAASQGVIANLEVPGIDAEKLEQYLKSLLGNDIIVDGFVLLAQPAENLIKGFGYGTPLRVDYKIPAAPSKAPCSTP